MQLDSSSLPASLSGSEEHFGATGAAGEHSSKRSPSGDPAAARVQTLEASSSQITLIYFKHMDANAAKGAIDVLQRMQRRLEEPATRADRRCPIAQSPSFLLLLTAQPFSTGATS